MEDLSSLEENSGNISKINSAGLVNLTLNNLWVDFFRDFRNGKYLSADNDLDCIWTILGGDLKDGNTEDKKQNEAYNEIEKELSNLGILRDSFERKGFGNIGDEQLKTLSKQKGTLLKKSLFLRKLQNKQGKGTAYDDGSNDYMD